MVAKLLVYLDYAAATPLDKRVKRVMEKAQASWHNPSALYQAGRQTHQRLEAARSKVANLINAKASEVVLTAGGTESINLAIQGVGRFHNDTVIVGAAEHAAVLEAARLAFKEVKICPVKADGVIDLSRLVKLLDARTVLVSIQYANNEVGAVNPIAKIARIIQTHRQARQNNQPLYFHSDASQAANYLSLDTNRLGVDLLTINGAKIYGPKQSGCLYVKAGTKLTPLLVGGGQERGWRSGTENLVTAVGLALALELAHSQRQHELRRLQRLQTEAIKQILAQVPDTKLNGPVANRLPDNLHLSFRGINGETLVHYLDQAGVMVATGAACNASKDVPSPTLKAMGLPPAEIEGSLRVTMGRMTTNVQVNQFIKILARTVELIRNQARAL